MIVTTLYACLKQRFWILVTSLGLWGIYNSMTPTTIMATFADSIQEEEQSSYFTRCMLLARLESAGWPAVTIVMFIFLGDQWRVRGCNIVMCVGQVIIIWCCYALWKMRKLMTWTHRSPVPILLLPAMSSDSSNHIIEGAQYRYDPNEWLNENYFCQTKSERKDESGKYYSKNMNKMWHQNKM